MRTQTLPLGGRPLTTADLVRANNVEAVHHIGDANHFFLKRSVVCPQGCGHRGWWLITRDAEIPERLRCPDCDRALYFAAHGVSAEVAKQFEVQP